MSSYAHLIESVRRTRKTLYLVAGLYIVVGFVVATLTAVQGDLLGTFLGFLIISGALSMAIIARTALHVLVRVAHIEASLDGFSTRLNRMTPFVRDELESSANEQECAATTESDAVLGLPEIGTGHAESLAAATLDRDVYPRLVSTGETGAFDPHVEVIADAATTISSAPVNGAHGSSLTMRNLLQRWKAALSNDDLIECRKVLSTMVDLADSPTVAPLRVQLDRLENRVERTFRAEFVQYVRSRDFAAAIEMGERICTVLGNHPVAADFERLRPVLVRRAEEASALTSAIH